MIRKGVVLTSYVADLEVIGEQLISPTGENVVESCILHQVDEGSVVRMHDEVATDEDVSEMA